MATSATLILLVAPLLQGPGGPPPAGGPVPPVPVPPQNPLTPAKALLGQALFWEEQLSSTRSVACGTCHVPATGSSDPRSSSGDAATVHPGPDGLLGTADDVVGSRGVPLHAADGSYVPEALFGLVEQVTARKSPPAINAAFFPDLFWDGRATGTFRDPLTDAVVIPVGGALEAQAAGPPVSSVEMGHGGIDWSSVANRIAAAEPLALAEDLPAPLAAFVAGASYPDLFASAFGSADVTPVRILMAIATYERTLIADQSPADLFFGGNPGALTPQEQQGRQIFNGPGRCNRCHTGPLFSDNDFHNIGVRPFVEDLGRFGETGSLQDRGAFKTPALRNVALRAPYFHNGSQETLLDVVNFYNRGGDFGLNQDPLIQPLGLNPQQRNALVAFLNALTDPRVASESGPFERPTLWSESDRRPTVFGAPTPGSAGPPRMIALEPPFLGHPTFTLALEGALAGAPAIFAFDGSSNPAGFGVFGATLYLAASPALQILPPIGVSPAGTASVVFALAADPSLAGQDYFGQWFAVDPLAPGGLAASGAVDLELF